MDKYKLLNDLLRRYMAKKDGENVCAHNNDLRIIKNLIISIFDLDEEMAEDLDITIEYHDIGKVSDFMQDAFKGIYNNFIRHEWIGASVLGLKTNQVLAIITTHKPLKESIKLINCDIYKKELQEVSGKLKIDLIDISDMIKTINRGHKDITKNLNNILLKGYLNYCDHLGSAHISEIDMGFIAKDSFKFKAYNSIQMEAMKVYVDVLIMAMTGFGKTAACLLWNDNVQNYNNSKRIYYILPYTSSINSLYRDFVERGISTAMLHSKAEYFLSKMDVEFTREDYKLLKYSTKQINICTIFQLVKAIFGCTRFEMLLAQMKNSVFIVDEIHCFDIKTLAYILELLRWLKINLNARICIMSASIPTCLQELIKERLNIETVIRPDEKELIIRHKVVRRHKTIFNDLSEIKHNLDMGKKIIICVNNVTTAQALYKRLSANYKAKLIHGKLNSKSREKAEDGIKDAMLLIGTQTIEVSLDISYDLMYTELAPLDSLLQRFGRINRKGEKGICEAYVYDNYNWSIYEEELLSNTDKALREIIENDDGIILEDKVNYYLDKVYPSFDIETYNMYKEQIIDLIDEMELGKYYSAGDVVGAMIGEYSMSVLPEDLLDEYNKLVNSKDYLNANALFVNISSKYKGKQEVWYDTDLGIYITNYKYDEVLGLITSDDV